MSDQREMASALGETPGVLRISIGWFTIDIIMASGTLALLMITKPVRCGERNVRPWRVWKSGNACSSINTFSKRETVRTQEVGKVDSLGSGTEVQGSWRVWGREAEAEQKTGGSHSLPGVHTGSSVARWITQTTGLLINFLPWVGLARKSHRAEPTSGKQCC